MSAFNHDLIFRFMFEQFSVRGEWIQLSDSLHRLIKGHNYPPAVTQQLSQAALASNLLVETLKFEGRLSLQVQSGGPLKLLLVQSSHQHQYRGVARFDSEQTEALVGDDIKQLMPGAQMALTIEPNKGKRYQGIVPMHQSSLAENIEDYFEQSEQLATRLWLFSNEKKAVGLMLQAMPEASSHGLSQDAEDGFSHLSQLADTLSADEALTTNPETLLHRLYHQDPLRLFDPKPIEFKCNCSRQKSLASVTLVPRNEIDEILAEEGKVRLTCDFCKTDYDFDSIDVEQIFANEGHDIHNSNPPSLQ